MAEGLTRYKIPPPGDAIIIHDRPSLNDLVKVYPETILHGENGGYYLKSIGGEVVAITADDLCKELDVTIAEADVWLATHESEAEDGGCGSHVDPTDCKPESV